MKKQFGINFIHIFLFDVNITVAFPPLFFAVNASLTSPAKKSGNASRAG